MQAVIMAGGTGTRLVELTKDSIPKPLAPVCGKPILEWQLQKLKENGIRDVILIIGHLGEKIKEHFGDGSLFGMNLSYIEETEPLGTAGALFYAKEKLRDGPFWLILGDVLFDIDMKRMEAFHEAQRALATLLVHPNAHPYDSDLIVKDERGRVLAFDSKHNVRRGWYDNCVNAGLYLLEKSFCNLVPVPQKTDLEKELLSRSIARGEAVYAYATPEYVKDVGTVERIRQAEEEWGDGCAARRNLRQKQRAVFLDRDGTVNLDRGLIYEREQLELEPSAVAAIKLLNRSGYLAIIVTNQPVVARGLCGIETVEEIHRKLKTLLGNEGAYVDDIIFCPHHPDKGYPEENKAYKIVCHCRKPDIGMIETCVAKYNIDLQQSWLVGDRTVDVQTGKNAGARTILLETGAAGQDGKYEAVPDLICKDLLEAAEFIVSKGGEG